MKTSKLVVRAYPDLTTAILVSREVVDPSKSATVALDIEKLDDSQLAMLGASMAPEQANRLFEIVSTDDGLFRNYKRPLHVWPISQSGVFSALRRCCQRDPEN